MEEKNNNNYKAFIVPIVAVAIFALMIFGAGYAYFAATVNTDNVTNINVVLPKQNTTITSTSSTCSMTINAADMVQSANSTTTAKSSSNCTLNVTLKGIEGVKCTYNVTLNAVPVLGQDPVNPTTYSPSSSLGSNKEFTGKLTLPTGATEQNDSTTETQINTFDGKVLASATITVPSSGTITQTYTFEEKWYNAPVDQGVHANRRYQYQLSMTNVKC